MSDINLKIKNSNVIRQNLIILSRSRVEDENLILDEKANYVVRYSPDVLKDNKTMKALYGTQKDEIETLHDEIQANIA